MPEDSSYRDLCSLNDVTSTLGITLTPGENRESLLTRLIKAASEEIYSFTGREFISATKDYWDDPIDTETRYYPAEIYGLNRNVIEIGDMMELPTDVQILSVTSPSDDPIPVETNYLLYPLNRQFGWPYTVMRLLTKSLRHTDQLAITGKWGFPQVPEDVRNGCIETVRLWYDQISLHSGTIEQELVSNQPTRNLPPSVIVSLNKYRQYRG